MKVMDAWGEYSILKLTREDKEFYSLLGWFFGSRQVARELGMPVWDDDHRIWLISLHRTDPIACSSIEVKGQKAILKSAWVKSEHRGKGIYARMLNLRLRIAKDADVRVVATTATDASNATLLKRGFRQIGMRGQYHLLQKEIGHDD